MGNADEEGVPQKEYDVDDIIGPGFKHWIPNGMPTRAALVVEYINQEGELRLCRLHDKGTPTWTARGMFQEAADGCHDSLSD